MISSVLPFSRNLSHVSVQSLPTYYFISLETKKHDYILWFNAHMQINHSWGLCVCVRVCMKYNFSMCVTYNAESFGTGKELMSKMNDHMVSLSHCKWTFKEMMTLKKKRTITKSIFENGIFSQRYLQFSFKITRFCTS